MSDLCTTAMPPNSSCSRYGHWGVAIWIQLDYCGFVTFFDPSLCNSTDIEIMFNEFHLEISCFIYNWAAVGCSTFIVYCLSAMFIWNQCYIDVIFLNYSPIAWSMQSKFVDMMAILQNSLVHAWLLLYHLTFFLISRSMILILSSYLSEKRW